MTPIELENERDESYTPDNPNIDLSRTRRNYHTVHRSERYMDYINERMKAKGNAGKHLATHPPLGYKKDPNDKEKWVIDERGAETVREIFSLCMNGYGPTQIARILTERKVDTPVVYFHKHGFLCLVEKYSSIEELTPEIIRSFVDKIIIHEKRKENGHYRQEVEIVYNFIGAVEFPDFLDDDEYDGSSC